ncbi:DUF3168 domain-containing protein [Devosia limi]|uniref:DUF3168 domain-containing protein n=1 Tax=Devosia limi DSM 17137 TaxID=1121477 RepID=A0A1M4X2W9_9HYPH|nr:DUF3168 domain-containing protein [Devosia limi]SHE87844.1 Protein of unknown function [Devosia limi DSM 17137]
MDASVDLIMALRARLEATPAVMSKITGIFDRVPEQQRAERNVEFPYVSLGPSVSIPADYDCVMGEEITIQFDVWSSGAGEAFGSVECRKICDAIKRALHDVPLSLTANALVTFNWEMTRILDDPNPAITHGVVQFSGEVETP